MVKKFAATLDKTSYTVTLIVMALCALIFISFYSAYIKSGRDTGLLLTAFLTPASLLIIVIAMYYLSPRGITITEGDIVIDRKIKPVTIHLRDIKAVYAVPKSEMTFTVRTFGNGGLFGYTGYYYNKKHGTMLWYCTQRTNYVMIENTAGKKIVITPDEPGQLLQHIQAIRPSIIRA